MVMKKEKKTKIKNIRYGWYIIIINGSLRSKEIKFIKKSMIDIQ